MGHLEKICNVGLTFKSALWSCFSHLFFTSLTSKVLEKTNTANLRSRDDLRREELEKSTCSNNSRNQAECVEMLDTAYHRGSLDNALSQGKIIKFFYLNDCFGEFHFYTISKLYLWLSGLSLASLFRLLSQYVCPPLTSTGKALPPKQNEWLSVPQYFCSDHSDWNILLYLSVYFSLQLYCLLWKGCLYPKSK